MRRFYLGVQHGRFLVHPALEGVPLTISRRTLAKRKTQPRREQGLWSLDSGAFTELSTHGRWTIDRAGFIEQIARIIEGVGSRPDWVGPRDWMCEPTILVGTGKTVRDHQLLTTLDCVKLREEAPEVPWVPVLQGWTLPEYLEHLRIYERWGVDLRGGQGGVAPLVGVGSVCRRQRTAEIAAILRELGPAGAGLRLHGFGVKLSGLTAAAEELESADSTAWSYHIQRKTLPGDRNWCGSPHHEKCSTCPLYARHWYDGVVGRFLAERADREIERQAEGL